MKPFVRAELVNPSMVKLDDRYTSIKTQQVLAFLAGCTNEEFPVKTLSLYNDHIV